MEDGDQHQIIGRVVSQADLDSCIRRSIAGQSLKGSIRGNLHNHSRLRRYSKKGGNKTGSGREGREGGGTEGNPYLSSNTEFTIGASSLTASSESDVSLFGSTSSLDGNVTPTTNVPSSSGSSSVLPTAVNVSELLGVGLVEGEVVVLEPSPK
jgi:hypothetical protein